MENIQILQATSQDIHQLHRISTITFYETYAAANTPENMKNYVEQHFSIDALQHQLSDLNTQFYLAILDGELIGYIKLNSGPSQTDLYDNESLEIERIYVLKAFYGRQVGQLLFEKAKQVAEMKKAKYVWLGVWEENPRAISFYKKNGFVEFDQHIFKLGDDEQTDIIMKLWLHAQ
jgi:ribosomal protein S18 acetylase RimI-like enzyme